MASSSLFQSKGFKIVVAVVSALVLLLVGFKAGMEVGHRKARFSYGWGENYQRNFAGPPRGFDRNFGDRRFMEASGVSGQILKIEGQNLTIKGRDNMEKMVVVNDKTTFERFRDKVSLADLKVDDLVTVIGNPNETGQIVAKFIRLMPPVPPAPGAPVPPPSNL